MPKNSEKSHACDETGRVIAYFGSTVAVEVGQGAQVICHWRRNKCLPVVGDHVVFVREANGEGGIIHTILPRKSVLRRSQGKGETKPMAANIDYLVTVMIPPPGFSQALVDNYSVAAELLGLKFMLVLNKVDLMTAAQRADMDAVMRIYRTVPYLTFMTSSRTGEGIGELEQALAGQTAVLVGPSGVGKSSLIARMASETIRVGEVSEKGVGRHTTTATRLYDLVGGGALIDSPGVRAFELWPIARPEVLRGFPEFQPYLTGCQFRDCSHAIEPGCAVQAAAANGSIHPHRFKHFQLLMQQAYKKK